jgi:hypothetical protein
LQGNSGFIRDFGYLELEVGEDEVVHEFDAVLVDWDVLEDVDELVVFCEVEAEFLCVGVDVDAADLCLG